MKTCEIKEKLPALVEDQCWHSIAGHCGTLILRIERLQLALANLSVMSPHYSEGKFEDHASVVRRMKEYAHDSLLKSDS